MNRSPNDRTHAGGREKSVPPKDRIGLKKPAKKPVPGAASVKGTNPDPQTPEADETPAGAYQENFVSPRP